MGLDVPERLGALIRGAVVRKEKRRSSWIAER
jgi:hypothetical protein